MKDKLGFLEGIRGWAALIVVAHHFVLLFYPALCSGDLIQVHVSSGNLEHFIAKSPLNILYSGNFAVCIFFVLSGFVLSYKYFKTDNASILVEYSLKRYFRLLPPVLLSVIIGYLVLKFPCYDLNAVNAVTKSGDWLTQMNSTTPSIMGAMYNAFIDSFINGVNTYSPVLWTMNIELLGSLLLFAVLYVAHFFEQKASILCIVMIVLVFGQLYYYSAFLAGSLLCLHYTKQNAINNAKRWWGSILLLAGGIYFGSYPAAWKYVNESIYAPVTFKSIDLYSFYHVLGSALIILAVLKMNWAMRLLSGRIAAFLGKISFSVYLVHLFIIMCLTTNLFLYFQPSMTYKLAVIYSILISLPVIFATSWLIYKCVDLPAVNLSGKMVVYFKRKWKFKAVNE